MVVIHVLNIKQYKKAGKYDHSGYFGLFPLMTLSDLKKKKKLIPIVLKLL